MIKDAREEHTENELQPTGKSAMTSLMINAPANPRVIVTDADGTILFINMGMERASGFAFAEIVGKKPGDLWGGHMGQNFYKHMWHIIKNEKGQFRGHVQNKTKDGKKYWQELQIFSVADKNSKIKFFIGIEHDIPGHQTLQTV
ncbi:MAG: PAS domain-containing protein [Patescibacteria group bacterium]